MRIHLVYIGILSGAILVGCGRPGQQLDEAANSGGVDVRGNALPIDDPLVRDKNGRVIGEQPTVKEILSKWLHRDIPSSQSGLSEAITQRDMEVANEDILRNPQCGAAFLGRGIIYQVKLNMSEKAMADFDQAIRLDPSLVTAYQYRGDRWLAKEEYQKAIEDFTEWIRLEPQNAAGYLTRALIYEKTGDLDRAVPDWEKVLQLRPDLPELQYYFFWCRGRTRLKARNLNEAIADFSEAIRHMSQHLDSWHSAMTYDQRGVAYSDKGDYDKAIADFEQAIRLDPKIPAIYIHLGNAYEYKGDAKAAIEQFTEAIRIEPRIALPLIYRALARAEEGDFSGAIDDCTRAFAVNPKAGLAIIIRGIIYEAMGDQRKAAADFNDASHLRKELDVVHTSRGLLLCSQGNLDKAIEEFSEAIKHSPNFHIAYYYRSVCYKDLGDTKKAQEDFQRAGNVAKSLELIRKIKVNGNL